jgi:hypothetical protein
MRCDSNRVRRIRGQIEAIEAAIEREADCSDILHTISACRGAINPLMAARRAYTVPRDGPGSRSEIREGESHPRTDPRLASLPEVRLFEDEEQERGIMAQTKLVETTERSVNSAPQCDNNHDHGPAHDHGTDGEHEHEQGWLEWARMGFVALILLLDWLRFVPRHQL